MNPSAVILCAMLVHVFYVYLLFMDRKPILKILSKLGENGRAVVLTKVGNTFWQTFYVGIQPFDPVLEIKRWAEFVSDFR